ATQSVVDAGVNDKPANVNAVHVQFQTLHSRLVSANAAFNTALADPAIAQSLMDEAQSVLPALNQDLSNLLNNTLSKYDPGTYDIIRQDSSIIRQDSSVVLQSYNTVAANFGKTPI